MRTWRIRLVENGAEVGCELLHVVGQEFDLNMLGWAGVGGVRGWIADRWQEKAAGRCKQHPRAQWEAARRYKQALQTADASKAAGRYSDGRTLQINKL